MEDWIPILKRWAKKEGIEVVGRWLYNYQYKDASWYRQLLRHMTVPERRREDKHRKLILHEMCITNAERIVREREMLQQLVTKLITLAFASL